MNSVQPKNDFLPISFNQFNSLCNIICIFRGIGKSHITIYTKCITLRLIALFDSRQLAFFQI